MHLLPGKSRRTCLEKAKKTKPEMLLSVSHARGLAVLDNRPNRFASDELQTNSALRLLFVEFVHFCFVFLHFITFFGRRL
jgi:hypothetical protein